MKTRRMAQEEAKAIAQFLGVCLQGIKGKELFQFFDFSDEGWERLVPPLENIIPGIEIHEDVPTIKGLFNAWKTQVNKITDQQKQALDIAAREPPDGLTFQDTGRKAWYKKIKEPNDEEWIGAEPADAK